ncbi:lysyl oxidase family protein [Nocardioides sp. AX2bis]|uniref:lysyl oxidase family protein n=1 Tax=Nocardioides sp. AX2bis TaxID=2653157 RepID=UPI0012F06D64|nr:lysyl oxidase family protein [Nocardioides sp. AX2bis]VXB23362.1 conserved exported hypothetical protein [Nocardioides sp. AX2bis]
MTSPRRLVAAAVLSTACAAGTLAAPGPAVAGPGHEDPGGPGDVTTFDGPLALMGPTTLQAQKDGRFSYLDLRVRAVAGAGDLEVRSNRPATDPYDGPITTTWTLGEQSGTFGSDLQDDFSGLPGLLEVSFTDAAGDPVGRTRPVTACLNGDSERIQPEGAASNAYPWGCPYNPYTLGSVQGVQDGYATRLWAGTRTRLAVGSYTATIAVGDRYADAWGLDPEESHVDVPLTVRKAGDRGPDWQMGWRDQQAQAQARTAGGQGVAPRPATAEPAPRAAADLPEGTPMPDLRSLPAFEIGLNGKGTQMSFAANVWNGGDSPLVVDGFRTADEDTMAAYQYFFDTDGDQVAYQSVEESGFYWHAENHRHWHFEDFARYQLLDADKQVVRDSGKVSFCLANTDAVDYTVAGADWHPENTDLSTACGNRRSLSVREVLSAGSGDTYAQYRAGQAFGRIKSLEDGTYYVRVSANPNGALVESDTTNNQVDRRVTLDTRKDGRRVVRAEKVGVVDEVWNFGGFGFGFFR